MENSLNGKLEDRLGGEREEKMFLGVRRVRNEQLGTMEKKAWEERERRKQIGAKEKSLGGEREEMSLGQERKEKSEWERE